MHSGKVGGHAAEDKKQIRTSSNVNTCKSYRKKRSFYRWPMSYISGGH